MKSAFGGSLLKNKRKSKRPLSFKKPVHLVLRLKPQHLPMFEPKDHILRKAVFEKAEKYQIKIYDCILNHSHMHSVILCPDRTAYVRFIREVTASITKHFNRKLSFLGVRLKRLFESRPFTRIVPWGRAFKVLKAYMIKNEKESGVPQKALNAEAVSSQMGLFGLRLGPPS